MPVCPPGAGFEVASPLGRLDRVAALIRAGYDPVLPDAARDPGHVLRLAARMPVDVVLS